MVVSVTVFWAVAAGSAASAEDVKLKMIVQIKK